MFPFPSFEIFSYKWICFWHIDSLAFISIRAYFKWISNLFKNIDNANKYRCVKTWIVVLYLRAKWTIVLVNIYKLRHACIISKLDYCALTLIYFVSTSYSSKWNNDKDLHRHCRILTLLSNPLQFVSISTAKCLVP